MDEMDGLDGFVAGLNGMVARVLHRPTGILGRHRPFYALNLADRFRGPRSLEQAVSGKTILITGASSGIGEAAAHRIGDAGGQVLLVARTEDKLEAVASAIADRGGSAEVHPCDLSDTDEIERVAGAVLGEHGAIDVLVNNAGHSIRRPVASSYERYHDFERTIQLNYLGAVRLILALLPGMRDRGDGHVINVSSAGVQTRVPRYSAYVASKAALDAFSECIQAELAHDGVNVTTIHMPLVRTPMIEPTRIYRLFPALTPEEAADWIAQAIVHRPPRIGTPYSEAAAVADAISPATLRAIRNAGYRLSVG